MQIQIPSEVILVVFLVIVFLYLVNPYRKRSGKTKKINQGAFLEELITGYNYWMDKGEKEYAEAYQVLINKFSQLEDPEQ